MISDLFSPIIEVISDLAGTVSSFITYVRNGIQSLLSIPATFPSLWSVVPSSITSVFLGILIVTTFVAILRFVFK